MTVQAPIEQVLPGPPPYQELPADAGLADFVQCMWQANGKAHAPIDGYTIIPDGCVDVVYELDDRQARCLAFGTTTSPAQFRPRRGATYLGIRFRPGMSRYFLDIPATELLDHTESLRSFLTLDNEEISRLSNLSSRAARVNLALRAHLAHSPIGLSQLDDALRTAHQQLCCLRVEEWASACGWSTRQLERYILASTGLPPKRLLRILRVQAALPLLRHAKHLPPADVALSLGYHDQSHMNRDFALLTGQTPAHFRTAPTGLLQTSNLATLTLSDFSKT